MGHMECFAQIDGCARAAATVYSTPSGIDEDIMQTIERFVILIYDRTSTCCDINKACRKIFARQNNVKSVPPTKAALEQVKCATYPKITSGAGLSSIAAANGSRPLMRCMSHTRQHCQKRRKCAMN